MPRSLPPRRTAGQPNSYLFAATRTLLIALCLLLTLDAAAQQSADVSSDDVVAEPEAAQADDRQVIEVDTVEAFVEAIGSDRILRLTGDEYLLSSLGNTDEEYVRASAEGFVILGVENLTIMGSATLLTDYALVPVLILSQCSGVRIEGIEMGHTPEAVKQYGACTGSVFKAESCEEIDLLFCDLFGCGAYGLELADIEGLRFESSRIYGCKLGLVQAQDTHGLLLLDSTFDDNELAGFGMVFERCGEVILRDCAVYENTQPAGARKWSNTFFTINDAAQGEDATHISLVNSAIDIHPFTELTNAPGRVEAIETEESD